MPSARITVDGLSQFLCPCLSTVPKRGFNVILLPGATSLIGCPKFQQRQTHTQVFSTRPRIGSRSLGQLANLHGRRCAHGKPFLVRQNSREQARIRDLDITLAYQELRRSTSQNVDYAHVRNIVKILVKERGQKPNLRLYDALLLANTDSENGSAGEVARILDEMAVEGLIPDSTTYHAALRVTNRPKEVRCCFGLHDIGSCCTSRLFVEATHTRRIAPTMVFFDQRWLA